jgi:homoserine acetyltransferase
MALSRESPARNLAPRGSAYKSSFDPEKALTLTQRALNLADPSDHYGDSIVACLHLVRAEALLCKAGRPMMASLKDEYEAARLSAAQMFRRLGMPRKLLRLDKLERAAGIIRPL